MFSIRKVNDYRYEIYITSTNVLCAVCESEREANVFLRQGHKKP